MTDNRWQVGVWGNYTDAEDEEVRKAIDATKQQFNCSSSEAAKWLIRSAYARLQGDDPIQESTAYAAPVHIDNTDVVEAINAGFAMLAKKFDNVSVTQVTQGNVHEATQDAVEVAQIEADVPAAVFLARNYASTKPGMRIQD